MHPTTTSRTLFATALLAACTAGCSGPARPANRPPPEPARAPAPQTPPPVVHASPAPAVTPPVTKPPESVDGTPPAWWLEAPVREAGRLRLAATIESDSLLGARDAAVAAATEALHKSLGRAPEHPLTERYSVSRLRSGRYRAFILMSHPE